MKKQVIAILVAAVLALMAVVALVLYAKGANDRALDGTETVEVLQATEDIDVKTPVSEIADKVELVKIPKAAQVPDALTSLDDVKDQVTKVALLAGDQLSEAKFDDADSVKGPASLPAGMQELSIQIDGERFVGGAVTAGDKVGVFTSFTLDGNIRITSNPINNLLVLKVDNGALVEDPAEEANGATTGTVITVAVTTMQAEQIVHAKEFGTIWLTRQTDKTDTSGGMTITYQNVAPFEVP
ncbi:Flp pilus assembly protein CpaB [Aeromicrobium sp. Leaf350]|uniref:Flp pilus assembly protein CpaB n=1 Tax=Aeromicrobium sp. Leaf350 TaxID=2876565 RepID=UPI001E3E5607|nr:Flp pilus assembly protein CpaB [Aeromicrobium sp. Leaf350]